MHKYMPTHFESVHWTYTIKFLLPFLSSNYQTHNQFLFLFLASPIKFSSASFCTAYIFLWFVLNFCFPHFCGYVSFNFKILEDNLVIFHTRTFIFQKSFPYRNNDNTSELQKVRSSVTVASPIQFIAR